ncbi:hypothetical protein M8C21_016277 [Ambrosia artemisiifolia]|uniref:Uncharacterized protein n=1 Tax=Ambrosia artemisiifolia TaxID=4212 RepID=A0AAD5GMB8_AMBAR|nr:hypothetical protein M8C21_016277 [Ambrosia artemisiifolia]
MFKKKLSRSLVQIIVLSYQFRDRRSRIWYLSIKHTHTHE